MNSITAWRTQESGDDEIFVKISGPGLPPLTTTTYRVRPNNQNAHTLISCLSFLQAPCPPGTHV